jgi:hypothetical protein
MTKAMRASVREISRDYVKKQLEDVRDSSTRIKQQDVNRAIEKVSKALLEVKAAQRAAAKK